MNVKYTKDTPCIDGVWEFFGWFDWQGLEATETIGEGEAVVEYIGEVMYKDQFNKESFYKRWVDRTSQIQFAGHWLIYPYRTLWFVFILICFITLVFSFLQIKSICVVLL